MSNKVSKVSILLLIAVIFMTGVSFFRYRSKSNDIINNTNIVTIISNDDEERNLGDVATSYGDASLDNKISAMDYILLRNHILGRTNITGKAFTNADINKDGKISAEDYVIIKNLILYNQKPVEKIFFKPRIVMESLGGRYLMYVGDSIGMEFSTVPNYDNYSDGKGGRLHEKVTWSSSNPNILSVDQNGIITAKGIGIAKITVTSSYLKVSDSEEFEVREGIVICKAGFYADSNECRQCLTDYYCPGGAKIDRKNINWNATDAEKGLVKCPSGFSSATGASSIKSCYTDFWFDPVDYSVNSKMINIRKYYGEKVGTLPTANAPSGKAFDGWYSSNGTKATTDMQALPNATFRFSARYKNAAPVATPTPSQSVTCPSGKKYVCIEKYVAVSIKNRYCPIAGIEYDNSAICMSKISEKNPTGDDLNENTVKCGCQYSRTVCNCQ